MPMLTLHWIIQVENANSQHLFAFTTEPCYMAVNGFSLIVRTEHDGIIDITLQSNDWCNADELEQTTEELKREIYDKDEDLEGEY